MLDIGNKVYRNLQEQVGYNSEQIKKIFSILDGIDYEDHVVVIEDISTPLTEDEMQIVNEPVSFLVYNNKLYFKDSSDEDKLYFSAVIEIQGTDIITLKYDRISVDISNGEMELVNSISDIYSKDKIDEQISNLETLISGLAGGSPKGVYATLADLQTAYPTGADGIYVVSADGHWYYWNGAAWTDGGNYLSTISAVPETRKIAGIDLVDNITQDELNNALQIKAPYLNAQDLDDVETIGNYVAVACSNTPVSGHSYLLQVQLYRSTTNPLDNPWIIQIAYDLSSSNFDCYFRRQNVNVWGSWQKVYTNGNFSYTIPDGSLTTEKLNNDCLIKYPYLNGEDLDDIKDLGRYIAVSCTNTPYNQTFLLDVQRYKTTGGNQPNVVQIALDYTSYGNKDLYFRVYDSGAWSSWKKLIDNETLESVLEDYLTYQTLFDYTSNLADPSKIVEEKFVNWQTGGIADSNDYRLEDDYIDVEDGDTYIALLNENDGIFYDDNYAILGAFYNSSRLYVDEIYITNLDMRGATFVNGFYKLTVPEGAKYFRFSVKDNANHYKWFITKNIQNFVKYGQVKNQYLENGGKLQGKTIVNFGDSIIGNTRNNTSVSSYLAKKTGAIVYNCGFGGCQMSKHSGDWDLCSMYQLANDIKNEDFSSLVAATTTSWSGMPGYFPNTAKLLRDKIDFTKVDFITISYGTNDYREGDSIVGNQVNIFDGNFDQSGYINPSNGQDAAASGYKRTSKYYPIMQVSNLYLIQTQLNSNFVLLFYDIDGNYLGYSSHSSSYLKYTFTVPNGAVCFRAYTNDGNTTPNCISYENSDVVVPYFNNEDVIDCLKYSVKTIKAKYPNIKILVTTPVYRSFLNSSNVVMTNSDVADFGGGTLKDYSQAYIKACEELKVPCLDLYHLSQLNEQTRDYFYPANDGTHPNEYGRKQIADLIGAKLEEM